MRVGGGTSIMPRVAPTLREFVTRRRRRVPEGRRGGLPDLRPPGVAAQEPRPRAHQGVRRQVRHRGAGQARSTRSSKGDWVAERDFDPSRSSSSTTRRPARPPCPPPTRARTATAASSSAGAPRAWCRSARPGFSTVQIKVVRGDLTPEQFRGLAEIMRKYSGGYARTTVHQNLVLRWVRDETTYEVWQRALRARARRRRRRRDQRRDQLPRHRLVQARHHELDGPEPRGARARRVDGDRGPAHQADPHQDVRLPERLQPAPHREHRVLRRVDQGRRAHDPRVRRAHRRQLRGRRGALRHAPEGAPARQARARRGRALDAHVRGGARGRRGVQRLRRARRARPASRTRSATSPCRSSSASRTCSTSSTGSARSPSRSSGARANARCSDTQRRPSARRSSGTTRRS